jgi:hypothetical protein
VTGSLRIDPVALRIEFDLMLESAVLRGTDSALIGLSLLDVRFQGSATLFAQAGPLAGGPITDGTAQVDGTAVGINLLALSPAIPFCATATVDGGLCGGTVARDSCVIRFEPSRSSGRSKARAT